jgi:hypothetical protein
MLQWCYIGFTGKVQCLQDARLCKKQKYRAEGRQETADEGSRQQAGEKGQQLAPSRHRLQRADRRRQRADSRVRTADSRETTAGSVEQTADRL